MKLFLKVPILLIVFALSCQATEDEAEVKQAVDFGASIGEGVTDDYFFRAIGHRKTIDNFRLSDYINPNKTLSTSKHFDVFLCIAYVEKGFGNLNDPDSVQQAFEQGRIGFVPKAISLKNLIPILAPDNFLIENLLDSRKAFDNSLIGGRNLRSLIADSLHPNYKCPKNTPNYNLQSAVKIGLVQFLENDGASTSAVRNELDESSTQSSQNNSEIRNTNFESKTQSGQINNSNADLNNQDDQDYGFDCNSNPDHLFCN